MSFVKWVHALELRLHFYCTAFLCKSNTVYSLNRTQPNECIVDLWLFSLSCAFSFEQILNNFVPVDHCVLLAEGTKASSAASKVVTSANTKPSKAAKLSSQKNDGSQVAASEKKGGDRAPEKDRKKDVPHPRMQYDDKSRVEKAKKRAVVKQTEARNRVELFRHLPQYEHGTQLPDLETKFFELDPMHPAVYKVFLPT